MNAHNNKSLASQLTHRIFAVYLALAIFGTALQIYFVCTNYAFVAEHVIFSIQFMLIALAALVINAAGLWFILVFFIKRLLTKPLREFTGQIQSLSCVDNFDKALPTSDIVSAPGMELTELRESFCELAASVASKLRMLKQEATEEIYQARSRFLSAASHDLRQPMHALNLYLASLSELDMSKPVHSCVDNVNKCAKAMNDMLDTLLEISNIDSGSTQVRLSIFPIASPMDRIQAEFEPLARAKGLTLRMVRCSAFVYTDEEIVERILRLLVSNAVRYTEHGKILIGCRRHGEQLRVAVVDTGLGIALDKQQAIFEEHVQLNNDERNRAKGLGLGLTIVQRLAKLLETSITLKSKPGTGSLFALDLPRIALDSIQPITPNLETNRYRQNRQTDVTVLVVDDEPLIRDATHTLLECWGYTVIIAESGRDALEQLTKNACTPDAIICDYLLEGDENGVDVITMLRDAFQKEIPALLVTGITLPEHIAQMRQSGLTYMYKPLDNDKLKVALSQLTRLNYVQ